MNPINLLSILLPIAEQIIGLVNKVKEADPDAWAAVSDDWKDTVAGWKALDQ